MSDDAPSTPIPPEDLPPKKPEGPCPFCGYPLESGKHNSRLSNTAVECLPQYPASFDDRHVTILPLGKPEEKKDEADGYESWIDGDFP